MAKRHKPRRGSMAFSPRKRAQRHFGRVKSWPSSDADEVRVQGFAGWKAGMTHVLLKDNNPKSTSAGQEVRVPVTVVEVPEMMVLGVRGYKMTPYGKQTAGEAWLDSSALIDAFPDISRRIPEPKEHDSKKHLDSLSEEDLCEVRLIVATQPSKVSGSPSKTPEVMELGLTGGGISAQLEWAGQQLGQEIGIGNVYEEGTFVDVVGITKGFGFQGVIRRFGGKLLSHKNSKRRRQHGNLGDKGTGYVRKTLRQAGQKGYHQRTEFNKSILRISNPEENEITPAGGFLNYGEISNPYMLIKGSLPGPAKRLVRLRDAVRAENKDNYPIDITYVSTASKQGV
ncbi:MAG: 50S ribosomal protein L3 [Euryarchaeota archaeon]|nr:50S ribosomal protein L3 [Euryarchaeota archaeon]